MIVRLTVRFIHSSFNKQTISSKKNKNNKNLLMFQAVL